MIIDNYINVFWKNLKSKLKKIIEFWIELFKILKKNLYRHGGYLVTPIHSIWNISVRNMKTSLQSYLK